MELKPASVISKGFLKNRKLKFIITGTVILAIIAAVLLIFVFKINGKSKSTVQQQTARVVKGNISQTVTGSGAIASSNRVSLTSAVTGTVKSVHFKEGDQVKKGDVLAEIDNTDAVRNIEQIKNNIEQTQLSINNNSKNLSSLVLKAPYSGRVTGVSSLKVGDDVQKNAALLTISDTSKMKVSLPFSSSVINELSEGMKATVNITDYTQSVSGTITGISSYPYTTAKGSKVYNAEITLNNPGSLRDGLTVSAKIATKKGVRTSTDSGKLEYIRSEIMKSLAGGTVKSINVKENQYVKAEATLVTMENDDLQVSSQTTDLKMQDLEAQLETAEKALNDYKVTSPIDGTIVSMDVVVGDELKPASSIATVIDTGHYEFSVDIDELDIAKIQVGQKVNVTLDALSETTDDPLSGKVTKIAVEGTSSNGVTTYPVSIQLDDSKNLRSGMNANAEIIISEKTNVLMVPLEALMKIGNRNIVMVKSDGQTSGGLPGYGTNQGNRGNRQWNGSNSGGSSNSGNSTSSNRGSWNGNTSSGKSSSGSSTRTGRSSTNSQYYANAVPTPVEIGITNDTYVEIISGLEEGQEIILPALTASSGSTQTQTMSGIGGLNLGGMGGMGGFNRNNQQRSSQSSNNSSNSNNSQQQNGNSNSPKD